MWNFSDLYDRKYLMRCLFFIAFVFGLMKVTGGAGFVIVVPVVFCALMARKTEILFLGLLVSICAVVVNHHVITKGAVFAWTQRGLMVGLGLCMTVQMLSQHTHRAMKPYLGMMAYLLVALISSLQGWCPSISLMKLFLFVLIYSSLFGVANQVGCSYGVSSRHIRSIMLSVAIFFVLGSMALIPFPALGQMGAKEAENFTLSTSLFMGMTNQPQCLGPVVSTVAVIVFSDLLFSIRKWDSLYLLILLSCPYLIYKTSSRTGMGAFALGMLFVVYLFMISRGVGSRWKRKAMNAVVFVGFVGLCVAVCLPGVRKGAAKFVLKTSGEGTPITTEAVLSSRQALIDRSLYNFKQSPFIGNGFQVSESMKGWKMNRLILTAPVEKGVWVTAVLEETGVVGFSVFVLFLVGCIVISVKRRAYMGAACLFVCTLTNLGEFTFFSMSYSGGFIWTMVFVGLALDIRRINDERVRAMVGMRGLPMYGLPMMAGGGRL